MNTKPYSHLFTLSLLCALGSILAQSAKAGVEKPTGAASTNAIPQSTFVDGRDPFFPHRRPLVSIPVTTTNPVPVQVTLKLQGISGANLCIVNGKTLAKGEEVDITTPSGRQKVRCIEIKEASVIVEAGGARQELRLAPD